MPKGLKTFDVGPSVFWFECECGDRWEGNSQRAKTFAHRLHTKVCNTSPLSNTEFRPVSLHKESKTSAIDAVLTEMKEGNVA